VTVYLDALGEEIAAETARAFAEERLGRPLTPGEEALDLVGLDLDLAEGKERLVAAIEAERRRALEVYLRGGAPVLRLTSEMEAAMIALVEAGRRHGREEMERLGVDAPFRTYAEGDERLARVLRELLAALTGIRVRLTEEARGARFGTEPITEELLDRLDRRIPGARDFAARISSGLFISGIGEIYESNADLFPCFHYSAVMDAATCEVCARFDGTRYESWIQGEVDLPGGGPNPACLGNGRCRCRLVPCPPTSPPPVDEEPLSPLDEIRRDAEDFPTLTDEEFVDLVGGRLDSESFSISGYASRGLRDREEAMRDLGKRIEEEADRRFDEEVFDREREESERRIDESRQVHFDELTRHQDVVERVRERVEREMFGERGASTNQEWDDLDRAFRSDPEVERSREQHDRIQEEHYRLVREERRRTDPILRHAENLRDVLAEIRALGGDFDRRYVTEGRRENSPSLYGYRRINDSDLYDMADDEARYLPSEWIERSNERGGFHVSERGRGHYADARRMVSISGHTDDERRSTMLHELGHRMEHSIPEIKIWEWIFMTRRIEESSNRGRFRLADLQPDHQYEDHEWSYPDDFPDPYTGRDYGRDPDSTTEVLTTGLEALFHGDLGDADHRSFVLGLLATIRWRPRADAFSYASRPPRSDGLGRQQREAG